MTDTAAARADLRARLGKMQSVGATILSNATLALKDLDVLDAAAAPPQPPASAARVVYGANTGGWWSTQGESPAAALVRIKSGFGGRLPAIRVWPSGVTDGKIPAGYSDPTCERYVVELNAGASDAQIDTALQGLPKNAVLVPAHEPENKLTPAQYQAYVTRVGARHVASGRTDVTVALMLMGNTYDPKRCSVNPGGGLLWDQWIPAQLPAGVDAIGGDLYPWGKDDAHADTADYVLGSAAAAAQKLAVPFYVGEFGCGSPKWSDSKRAEYTSQAFDLCDASPQVFPVVCVFEADNGSSGPWCILPRPDGTGGYPLTADVVRKRILATP